MDLSYREYPYNGRDKDIDQIYVEILKPVDLSRELVGKFTINEEEIRKDPPLLRAAEGLANALREAILRKAAQEGKDAYSDGNYVQAKFIYRILERLSKRGDSANKPINSGPNNSGSAPAFASSASWWRVFPTIT